MEQPNETKNDAGELQYSRYSELDSTKSPERQSPFAGGLQSDRGGSGYDAPPPTRSESTLTRNGTGADGKITAIARNGLVDMPVSTNEMPVEEPEVNGVTPPAEIKNPNVMLSTEIAALTGKRHSDVLRDIEVIIDKMQNSNLSSGFKSTIYAANTGQSYKCYELDYEATMIVLTGYDVVARAKVIKRWQEIIEEPIENSETPFSIEIYIKNIGNDEVNAVNARELHEKLKVATKFADWIKRRIAMYAFAENTEWIALPNQGKPENNGFQEKIDYFISLDMAKELSMVENNDQGKIARRYFIECEKMAKSTPKPEPIDWISPVVLNGFAISMVTAYSFGGFGELPFVGGSSIKSTPFLKNS
ncbi:MAG: antA/AntB antirepressor family protein [Methylococcales bacterium]|nr:antA/AntB antirepressor family protein [Methylococcales bacterium]MDD5753971.1 antA/AntB antirepressor family protein [Methylococcales bacterium]